MKPRCLLTGVLSAALALLPLQITFAQKVRGEITNPSSTGN